MDNKFDLKNYKRRTIFDKIIEKAHSSFDNTNTYIPAWQNLLNVIAILSIPFALITFILDLLIPMTVGMILISIFILTIIYFSFYADRINNKYYMKSNKYFITFIPYFFTFYCLTFLNIFRLKNFINGGEFDAEKTFGYENMEIIFEKLISHTFTASLIFIILVYIISVIKYIFFRRNKMVKQKKNISNYKLIKSLFYLLSVLVLITFIIELSPIIKIILNYFWESLQDIFNYV